MSIIVLIIDFVVKNWQIVLGIAAVVAVYLWFQGELRAAYKQGVFDEHTRLMELNKAKNNEKYNIIEKAATELELAKKETLIKLVPVERKVYEYIQVPAPADSCKVFNPTVPFTDEYIGLLNSIANGGLIEPQVPAKPTAVVSSEAASVPGKNS